MPAKKKNHYEDVCCIDCYERGKKDAFLEVIRTIQEAIDKCSLGEHCFVCENYKSLIKKLKEKE